MDASRFDSLSRARLLGIGVLALALLVFVGGAWLAGAGTAHAPEPARLVEDLTGTTGATGAAVYSYSEAPTTVLKWPSTYVNVANPPAAGTPCSVGSLWYGDETRRVIQRAGNYARCF